MITRRQVGLAAIGASAMAQTQTAYTGALDKHGPQINQADFDPVAWTLERYKSAPLKLSFKAENRKQAEAWQKKLRPKIATLLGGSFSVKGDLKPQTLEKRDYPGYTREKFVIESRPGLSVLGYLLIPKDGKVPHPAVVCLPGHGRGVDDIVGIDDKGRDRTDKAGYQHDFALQVVEKGMAAVAIEQMAFGCRRDHRTSKGGLGRSACQPTGGAAFLLGETMIGWRVQDVMRTIDWIETRKELDAKRVGVTGISGGGTITVFSAALEPRIKAAFASGYLNTFRDSIFSISHCIDNYVPGILEWAEMYDVAGLIAPRPFFAESGTRDNIFPVAAAKESFQKVKHVYEVLGASELAGHEAFEGEHSWHGARGIPFLAQHLGA
ncbi:MAG TPA: alpha/beta hydrolase family protein [Bryobacteraceae bacterium]|nr:alpha/beta hydrolase family protein [Bryobacteraceae bacterium]